MLFRSNMEAIARTLQERQDKLDELEKKFKNSGYYNNKLQQTIENLKTQIANQETTIANLQTELENANIQIQGLTSQVSNLNSQVETVSAEKQAAQAEATRVANELNTCYYVVGSNKELKKNDIISKKFLGKTKVMEGDYEIASYTKADKRTLNNSKNIYV